MSRNEKRHFGHEKSGDGFVGYLICGLLCLLLSATLALNISFITALFTAPGPYLPGSREFTLSAIPFITIGIVCLLESPWRKGGRTGFIALIVGIMAAATALITNKTLPSYAIIGPPVCSAMAAVFYGLIIDAKPWKAVKPRRRKPLPSQPRTGTLG